MINEDVMLFIARGNMILKQLADHNVNGLATDLLRTYVFAPILNVCFFLKDSFNTHSEINILTANMQPYADVRIWKHRSASNRQSAELASCEEKLDLVMKTWKVRS